MGKLFEKCKKTTMKRIAITKKKNPGYVTLTVLLYFLSLRYTKLGVLYPRSKITLSREEKLHEF